MARLSELKATLSIFFDVVHRSIMHKHRRLRAVPCGFCLACLTVPVACAQEKNQELKKATDWLKSTMEQYGDVKDRDTSNAHKISNVKFDGCSMQWMDSWWQQGRAGHPGEKLLIETTYHLQLGDLNCNGHDGVVEVNGIQGGGSGDWVKIGTPGGNSNQRIRVEERVYFTDAKGGNRKEKGEARTSWEGWTNITIKNEVQSKFIETLDRAIKLCGGVPKNE